jgi:hypothetical protein
MKKKNFGIYAITLVIAGLMITSAISITAEDNEKVPSIQIMESKLEKQTLEMQTTPKEMPMKQISKTLGDPEFNYEGDQLHPAFGRSVTGQYMAAYRDDTQEQVIWTYTNEDGVYYDLGGGDYPSIKLWDGTTFYGTLVPDYLFLDGAAICIFGCTDPTNFDTYQLLYWDWSDNGWSDIIDMEIACDNSQESWEWGFVSLVASTTYGDGVNDGPFISYQTAEDGYATISWYYVDGCEHADADIDHANAKTYAAYDLLYEGNWELLLRRDDFSNWDGASNLYEITGGGNLQYPAVAVHNNKMVLLAETDENGHKDIVCIYGSPQMAQTSYVTTDAGDEMYPDVRHVEEEIFICTFVKDNTLYTSVTEDAGATWSTPVEVDTTEEEYKTADISDYAAEVMYEVDNGFDIDIWRAPLGGGGNVPVIEIASISGGVGVSAAITNTGTADAEDVEYTITVTGGILGFINKEVTGTIPSIAIDEEVSISTGLILGLGAVEITVTADTASETTTGTQILIFTMV